MFTGLVLGKGRVEALDARGGESRLAIRPLFGLDQVVLGESIAVNGACLTVETWSGGAFTAYASAETLSRTNLGRLRAGSLVNLERALALGDRLGGHMVSGHVDCLAAVTEVRPAGQSTRYTLRFDPDLGALVVPKGSVALDGISLTVNECGPDYLSVNIIPVTQKETTIGQWSPGYEANMECDVIGKYVQRMLAPHAQAAQGRAGSGITPDFLAKHGF